MDLLAVTLLLTLLCGTTLVSASSARREKRSASYGYKGKNCYQCGYTPPRTIYQHSGNKGYGGHEGGGGGGGGGGYGGGNSYGYGHKTVYGGWDKCLGPFDHYQADHFGVDVWECHSNCYVRRDHNGDIFRGCYKGEYGVDPYRLGCHYQGGSTYCFCEGDRCNNGEAPGN